MNINTCFVYRTINKNILRVAPDKAAVTFEPQYSEPVADDANPLKQVTFTNTDAGKAVPYTQPQFKICGQYQVTVHTHTSNTHYSHVIFK